MSEVSGVVLRLLGPVAVKHDNKTHRIGATRSAAILARLAQRPGQVVQREELIAAAWGEDAPASARGNLYTYVSGLRESLAAVTDRPLIGAGGGYRLNLPADLIDVHRFTGYRNEARRHRAAGDAAGEESALREALTCWSGTALEDVPGPFARAERLRLAEDRRAATSRLSVLCSGQAPPFLGRQAELSEVLNAIAGLAAGSGGAIAIEGGAGFGKTALLGRALSDTRTGAHRTGWATADDMLRDQPLGVLTECLAAAGVGPLGGVSVVEAVREAARRPLVLVLDDFHLADGLSRQAWADLRSVTSELPLLLISAGQPERGEVDRQVISLGALPESDAAVLAGPGDVTGRVAEAAGNPAYLRSLAAPFDGGASLAATVHRHVDRLPLDCRWALRAMAALGETVTTTVLRDMSGHSDSELRDLLGPARAAGIIADDGAHLRFRHPVVARVLRAEIPEAARLALRPAC